MKSKGYGAAYSTAVTIAGAIIGPIIPPSLTFIIYSLAVGNLSIGAMFLAGIVPGLAVGFALMGIHYYVSKKRNYEKRTTAYTWGEIFTIVRRSLVVAVMPGLIVVGISTGGLYRHGVGRGGGGLCFCHLFPDTPYHQVRSTVEHAAQYSQDQFDHVPASCHQQPVQLCAHH